MINIALAIAVGIITIITIAVNLYKGNEQKPVSEKVLRRTARVLDALDDSRETRYAETDRHRLIRQLDGFRSEWNSYYNEYSVNFSMD